MTLVILSYKTKLNDKMKVTSNHTIYLNVWVTHTSWRTKKYRMYIHWLFLKLDTKWILTVDFIQRSLISYWNFKNIYIISGKTLFLFFLENNSSIFTSNLQSLLRISLRMRKTASDSTPWYNLSMACELLTSKRHLGKFNFTQFFNFSNNYKLYWAN